MKRIIALILVSVMLAVSVSALHEHAEDDTRNFWRDDKTNVFHSFDTVFIDGVSQMDLKWSVDGKAAKVITDNPLTVGENVNDTIALRGWVGMNQTNHAGVTVAELGYYTNDDPSTYVMTGDLVAAEQAVLEAGGEYRFENLTINVTGMTKPTLFTITVKGSDGNLYDFGEFSINGNYEGAEEPPQPDAPEVMNYSFDTLYVNDLENFVVNNGAAGAWLEENPISDAINAIRIRGWARLGSGSIEAFGYRIDDGVADIDTYYIFDREDVWAAFGTTADKANGFDITMDVSEVDNGAHTVTVYVVTPDGMTAKLFDFSFTQEGSPYVTVGYLKFEDRGDYYSVYRCDNNAEGEITIPDFIERNGVTKPVKEISDYAFNYRENITSVIIPDSVEKISYAAFAGCRGLRSINIPNSVKTISGEAFYGCSSLTNIVIPNSITSLVYHTFAECSSLENISVPDSVEYIGEAVFFGCSSLTEITIPEKVMDIRDDTFYGCRSLKCIDLPEKLTSIGSNAFLYCSTLQEISLPEGLTYIGKGAFSGCSSLSEIVLPESLSSIEAYTFENCSNLKKINIGNNIVSIGYGAFYGCESLNYNEYNNGLYLGNNSNKYVVLIKAKDRSITSCKTAVNTKFIYNDAFNDCEELKSVDLSDSITEINDSAFSNCIKLTEIKLPGGLKEISNFTFDGCESLQTVIMPDELFKIRFCAFRDCTALKNIEIPYGVYSIGDYAFCNCPELAEIDLPDTVRKLGRNVFYSTGLTSVYIPDSVTSIVYDSFNNCNSLTNVTIPKSVYSIQGGAFNNCKAIKTAYYFGTEQEWNNNVSVDWGNEDLTDHLIFHPEHTFGEEIVIKAATSHCVGITGRTCSVCGYTEKHIIEKLEFTPGDCNGDGSVDNKDVVILFRYVSGAQELDDDSACDFNNDGAVDNKDVVALFRYVSAR